ncbi:MAG: helix-turn-helix transcriptional regulator [Lysobacteraceae bacterium]
MHSRHLFAPSGAALSRLARPCVEVPSRRALRRQARDRDRSELRHCIERLILGADPVPVNQPRLLLVVHGELLARARDYRFQVSPGHVLVLDGREPFLLQGAADHEVEVVGFYPDPRGLRLPAEHVDNAPACSLLLPMVHDRRSAVAGLMLRLEETLRRTDAQRLEGPRPAQFWLDSILAAQAEYQPLVDRCHGRTPERRRDLFVRLARVRAMLSMGDGGDDDIERLAVAARLSPSHFVRLFHKVFGEPPHSFRLRCRMEQAHRLVCNTALSVQEVMARVGFDNHSCFARAFRRHFGCSASAIREQREMV